MTQITNSNPIPQQVAVLNTDRQMSTVRFSPCGRFLAAAGRDATIRLWSCPPSGVLAETSSAAGKPDAGKPIFSELAPLTGHNGWVTSIAFHPRHKRLFAVDSWGQLCAWPYETPNAQPPAWQIRQAHEGWIRQLAISPDGEILATCGMDRMIRLWSAGAGAMMHEFAAGEDVYSLAWHPDGKSLVSGDLKGVIKHWDLTAQTSVREFDGSIFYMLSYIQDVGGVRSLAFDATGTTLAAAGTKPSVGGFVQGTPVVRFLDWASGKETQTLKLGDDTDVFVHELTYHPQGFWLGVASGQPGKGKFFLLKPGELQPFFESKGLANCHSAAMDPQGSRLAVIANAGTFGQLKSQARQGVYPGNTSPIHIWNLGAG